MACSHCRRRKLRCDGSRPLCSNCTRFKQECEYIEVQQQRRGARKRNTVKEHEKQPAVLETQTDPTSENYSGTSNAHTTEDPSAATLPSLENSFGTKPTSIRTESTAHTPDDLEASFVFNLTAGIVKPDDDGVDVTSCPSPPHGLEVSGLGGRGVLPYESVRDELTDLFFRDVYPSIPILHKTRYYASLRLESSLQPPLCLRHVIWALAALQHKQWNHLAASFYEKARTYLEQDEMKDGGSEVLTVSHVQCWCLIAAYESYTMQPLRAWSSIRRAAALAQMLRLHTIDTPDESAQLLPGTRDPSELEERRRAFWSAFCSDRWASARTGYPMTINEAEIATNLPSSEDSFNFGTSEPTQSLTEALELGLDSNASLYGARAVLASILGRVMRHVLSATSADRDLDSRQFWTQHEKLDDLVAKVSLSRSARLRPTKATTDTRLWAFDMWLHGITVILHQTATDRAKKQGDDKQFILSVKRCRAAADKIIATIRSMAHVDARKMDPFTASCVYMASTVLIRSHQRGDWRDTDLEDLRFLKQVLQVLYKHWKVADIFIKQFDNDLAKSGITLLTPTSKTERSPVGESSDYFSPVDQTSSAGRAFTGPGLLPV